MHVLVLGGTGFMGPHVVRRLLGDGHEVTVAHRGETEAALPPQVRHIHMDLTDFDRRAEGLRGLEPRVVLDMIALRAEDARRALAFAGLADRAVVASSADVYRAYGRIWRTEPGPPDHVPLTEDSPLREQLSHAGVDYDKTGVERELRGQSALPVTILRLPAVHGPGDPQHRLHPYLRRMDDRRPAIVLEAGLAGWRWVRGYVEDVAYAIYLAVVDRRAAGRTYNVADQVTYTEIEWVREIARVHGWDGEIVALPADELPEAMRHPYDFAQDYVVGSSRIREELGYAEQVPFDEALRRTIEWERANPPSEPDPDDVDYETEDEVLAARR